MACPNYSSGKWIVVLFMEYDCVETIPQSWYDPLRKTCFFPPEEISHTQVCEYIKFQKEFNNNWPTYKVRLLGKDYDTYKQASMKANKAKTHDVLSSACSAAEDHKKRTRKPNKKYNISSSDEVETSSDEADFPTMKHKKLSSSDPSSLRMHKNKQARNDENSRMVLGVAENTHAVPEHNKLSTDASFSHTNTEDSGMLQASSGNIDDTGMRQMQAFQKQVLRQLAVINSKLSQHSENFQVILECISKPLTDTAVKEDELLPILEFFPLKSTFALNEFEELLTADIQNGLAKELGRIGGDNPKKLTKRIMYRIMSNEAGEHYSYEGAKGKLIFKSLSLCKVVIKAVRSNPRTSEAPENEIVESIKAWLAQSKNRLKIRRTRINNLFT